MNRNTIRALIVDARYQVFDNVVFRILLGGVALLIALSFLIAFKEDHLVLFFGLWEWDYESVFFVGAGPEAQLRGINWLQSVIVEQIVGSFGIMLCIAATAFFTPRLLEKGAADNSFSKPVGRFTLLMSRYFAGVLFVALLSLTLVGGLFVGFAVSSGYSDTGFLWSAFTLIYLYAILQAVSVMVATFTRNSVAAILVTLTFFSLNGCVNMIWLKAMHTIALKPDLFELDADEVVEAHPAPTTDAAAAASDGAATTTEEITIETSGPPNFSQFMDNVLTPLRTILPRTGDADILSRRLKQAAEGIPATVAIEDQGEPVFYLQRNPTGFTFQGGGLTELDGDGLRWISAEEVITVQRRPRLKRTSRTGREGFESITSYINADVERLRESAGKKSVKDPRRVDQWRFVEWRSATDTEHPKHVRTYDTQGEYLFLLELASSDSAQGAVIMGHQTEADNLQMFMPFAHFGVDPRMKDTDSWYEMQFTTSASWQFNILASIGSSVAFACVMLLLACWRIRRMDF